MSRTHPVQKTAAKTRKALVANTVRAERAAARSGKQALHRLAPQVDSLAAELESVAGRAADQARRGYHHLAPHVGPTAAQLRRTRRRRRTTGFASLGLLGLAGALVWRWRARASDEEWFSLPTGVHDEPQPPREAVAAVSDRGVEAAQAVEDSTLTTGPAGATGPA